MMSMLTNKYLFTEIMETLLERLLHSVRRFSVSRLTLTTITISQSRHNLLFSTFNNKNFNVHEPY